MSEMFGKFLNIKTTPTNNCPEDLHFFLWSDFVKERCYEYKTREDLRHQCVRVFTEQYFLFSTRASVLHTSVLSNVYQNPFELRVLYVSFLYQCFYINLNYIYKRFCRLIKLSQIRVLSELPTHPHYNSP